MNTIRTEYKKHAKEIKNRLAEFKNLSEEQIFQEFQFCLLTPQSNAQRCWSAVEELTEKNPKTLNEITKILAAKTRFHRTKAKRILNAKGSFESIRPFLQLPAREARDNIVKSVNGYGLKEASHFLRNIGKSDNQIAILDRHILRNLHALNIIDDPKIKSQKNYLEKEKAFIDFSDKMKIPAYELDLLWWSQENGEIFK